MAVDGRATNHDIVHDGEAAFTADIVAVTVADLGIGENGSFVKVYASTVLSFCKRDFLFVEPVPDGPVDDLVWGKSEDVDNGIGAVENLGILREVCRRKYQPIRQGAGTDHEW